MKHILIIASYGPSLINFRISLIEKLLSNGHKVTVASPRENFSDNLQKKIQDLGITINFFSLSRTSLNFFRDIKSIMEIFKIIKKSKPDIIISYTAKPVIYTGIILKYFSKISYFPLITGLGFAFTETHLFKQKIIKFIMINLYKIALKNAVKVCFQNEDDQLLFLKLKILKKKYLSYVVNGSGIDLKLFPYTNLPSKPIFLMISRLLVDKGVREYVDAARIVRSRFSNVLFQLAGYLDENPSGITNDELQSWINKGDIEYLGEVKSVQSILKSCRFFVLPSYREGTPRSTLEALATGRPVITTNVPGCRETVIHKKNGLLVPVKNHLALASAMIKLLNEKNETIEKMAYESYLIAKNKYEINKVNQSILNIMKL